MSPQCFVELDMKHCLPMVLKMDASGRKCILRNVKDMCSFCPHDQLARFASIIHREWGSVDILFESGFYIVELFSMNWVEWGQQYANSKASWMVKLFNEVLMFYTDHPPYDIEDDEYTKLRLILGDDIILESAASLKTLRTFGIPMKDVILAREGIVYMPHIRRSDYTLSGILDGVLAVLNDGIEATSFFITSSCMFIKNCGEELDYISGVENTCHCKYESVVNLITCHMQRPKPMDVGNLVLTMCRCMGWSCTEVMEVIDPKHSYASDY